MSYEQEQVIGVDRWRDEWLRIHKWDRLPACRPNQQRDRLPATHRYNIAVHITPCVWPRVGYPIAVPPHRVGRSQPSSPSPSPLRQEAADLGPACWFLVSRRALAPVAGCGEATKPGLAPIGSLNQQPPAREKGAEGGLGDDGDLAIGDGRDSGRQWS